MAAEVVIRVGTFDERLDAVDLPLVGPVRERLVGLLEAEAVHVGLMVRGEKHREYACAVEGEALAQSRMEEARHQLDAAEATLTRLQQGTVAILGALLACFAACFWAEYVLNAAVVPWLLSVPRDSWLGIALSMAPATAPVVLDRVFVAVFHADDTWEALRSKVLSPLNVALRGAVRYAFFAAVGALTLYEIWLLAASRGVASFLKNNGTETVITSVQQQAIDQSLIVLSVAVTVSAALFYVFGVHEWHRIRAFRAAKKAVSQMRALYDQCRNGHAAAKTERVARQRIWDEIAVLQWSVADTYVAEGLAKLAQAAATPGPVKPVRQVVEERLTFLNAGIRQNRRLES